MHLTDDEKKIGKENFNRAMGDNLSRRDFMKDVGFASLVGAGGLGAAYFGYSRKLGDPLRIGIIGTGDEGNVLIGALNPDFVKVVAIADIRPNSIFRAFHGDNSSDETLKARPGLISRYGYADEDAARKEITVYDDGYDTILDHEGLEAVIVALPLWLHDYAAIKALRKGKHVLTEKLMAHSVARCKEMSRVAEQTGLFLATGHQRHYSILYDNAVDTIRRGLIGDIHHIRAQWHRGNLPGNDSWQPPMPEDIAGYGAFDQGIVAAERAKDAKAKADLVKLHPLFAKYRSFKGALNKATGRDVEVWQKRVKQIESQLADAVVDAAAHKYEATTLADGYQRSALEELIRWRLWNRTGGGLMSELGSHQLDASGIFVSAQLKEGSKAKPLSVIGVGGRHIFPADRDASDHVYCMYEYPAKGYYEDNDPELKVADPNKKCVVTYSSINGSGYGGYGEVVLGTGGTLILEREQETLLFKNSDTATSVKVDSNALVASYETGGGYTAAAEAVIADVSRGYTEEIEHWAWCIREKAAPITIHCHPKVALADAVIALTSNIAMEKNQRIEFDPEWFNIDSDATPEGTTPRKAADIS
jgi:predicted dehydrogenase